MKILIIAQHIFPMQTPRAHRATELLKEFARQGHEVTVYAVLGKYDYSTFEKEYNVKVKNIPIKFQKIPYDSDGLGKRAFIDKVLEKLFRKYLQFPTIEFLFSVPKVFKNEQNHFDILISIADPHHIHWGCSRAKKLYPNVFPKCWIADCGDPFMFNDKTKEHLKFYGRFEKQFCELANFITVPIKEAIEAYYPEYRNKIKVIPQGFSFDLSAINEQPVKNRVPTFAFAGMFYSDIRNPKMLLDYLSKVKTDFRFIIFTKFKNLVLPYKQVLKEKLDLRDVIERDKLIEYLKSVDFLINIENINSPNQIPSKLIDYTLTGRPILSINNCNFDEKLIDEFLAGDYSNKYVVNNIEQYHIKNVAKQFLILAAECYK